MTMPLATFMAPELLLIFFFFLTTASVVVTIWSVIEIATKSFVNDKDKVLWLIICVLLGGIGPLIYLTQRKKLLAEFNDQLSLNDLNIHPSQQNLFLPHGTADEDYV